MVTEAPVKEKTDIKELDNSNVKDWVKKKLILNLSSNTSLKHCYEAYKNYLEFEKKVVPLTKKSFSILFRELLREDENKGKLRFYQRCSILIKGVEIVE